MIYEPSEDSFLLRDAAKKYVIGKKVLDLGAGSGIQGISALKNGAKEVIFSDINEECIKVLKSKGFKAKVSDLFENIKGKYDLILFNPPYLPKQENEDFETGRIVCGGKKGDEIIIRFLENVKDFLNDKGIILLLVSSLTPMKGIDKILKKKNFKKDIIAKEKFFMEELYLLRITFNKDFR